MIAAGKAACAMARGAQAALGERIGDALVVTKHGYGELLPWPVLEAGHPLPDEHSLDAGARLLDFVRRTPVDATVLVLLSGGASALVEALPPGVTLADLRRVNDWLLAAGLPIAGMNAVRKRLSRIKGGRLAALLAPRPVLCLAISDVAQDDARVIASGPLSADAALRAPLAFDAPDWLTALLRRAPPVPAPDDACFKSVHYRIVARLDDARRAAADAARQAGMRVDVHEQFVDGDAVAAGQALARALLDGPPDVLHVWGGETIVQLPPRPGRGGRCQSLALAAAQVLDGRAPAWLLAAGTDGSDGPTEDAGALVDAGTLARGKSAGLNADQCLTGADAGSFLEASGDLLHTGPTGTNVMDLMLGVRTL